MALFRAVFYLPLFYPNLLSRFFWTETKPETFFPIQLFSPVAAYFFVESCLVFTKAGEGLKFLGLGPTQLEGLELGLSTSF